MNMMKKKILCGVLAFAIVCPASMLRADDSGGKPVKVIMKDGGIVNGDMVGLDGGTLTLQTKGGKSKDISVSNIKKVFDADGNAVPLNKDAEPAAAAPARDERASSGGSDSNDEEQVVPRRSRRKAARERAARHGGNGLKVTGIILDIVGGVGFGLGLYMDLDGANNQSSALSTYTNSPGYATDGNYYDYYVNGKYYTYNEYESYLAAQAEQDAGITVAVVGGALLITGIILGAVGSSKANQESLLDVEDGKVAWGVPMMDYNPNTRESKLTLLTAQF